MTKRLADFLAAARFPDFPPQVLADTHRAILDWLGSALAGSLEPPARMTQSVVAGFGISQEATVFSAPRASAAAAALANGVASHILEFDDVHKGSTLHAAAPIIPAALAVAEREHVDGQAFLLAVALGYETAFRIGEAVNPSHYRFWHPTGTVATFGAAAAAGSILKLNATQMLDALGTAGTQAAGLWEFNADGAMSKHLHPGKAAFNGVLSADLAKAGFTGASRILEGDRGFIRAMSESGDAPNIIEQLGEHWKITENCYKLHSCCGHAHTAIDLALQLRADAPLDQIASIDVETYGPGYEIVKESNPRTPYQAKFSLAYCVAAAFTEGRVGLEQFAEDRFGPGGVLDPTLAALLPRIHATVAADLTAEYPAAWPARMTVVLKSGPALKASTSYPRGNPENPVSTADLLDKFTALIAPRFGDQTVRRALAAVDRIDRCGDVAELFSNILEIE